VVDVVDTRADERILLVYDWRCVGRRRHKASEQSERDVRHCSRHVRGPGAVTVMAACENALRDAALIRRSHRGADVTVQRRCVSNARWGSQPDDPRAARGS
jgi:hypothetical protein